jgi:hypothetical protein
MSTKASLPGDAEAVGQIKASASSGKLVAIVGTGVSIALTSGRNHALSWKGLVENGFSYGVTKGTITAGQHDIWKSQLNSNDLDDLLAAAEFMGRKLDAPNGGLYARWLENVFQQVKPENAAMEKAVRAINSAGVPVCTLNYDPLLERVTGLTSINMSETTKVTAWMRRDIQGILHLHGSWDAPTTCILGIRDYETAISNELRDLIQRTLGSFTRLLFIGCGDTFGDPNFSALIKWLRQKMKTAAPQHYALVSASEVAKRHADSAWQGFVDPVSYGTDHKDLAGFLIKQFPVVTAAQVMKKARSKNVNADDSTHARILQEYRSFLLRDCGQMTIEGVRADMDTAQRRFELERLFVPLRVLPTPPEIPANDPEREKKLLQWQEKNKTALPFGQVFQQHQRLALLALPGGGKTLLLKRLAVAYADAARRRSSDDGLPELDLTPVLIRCREWKEHIRRPILALLQNIAAITGQKTLAGLSDALIPLLKKGRILFLIDGLDEIHNDADRSTFVDHLEAFLNEYRLVRLVVTSREAGFSLVAPSLARFCERWRVAPLEEVAIKALCRHWQRLMTGESPEALAEGLEVAEILLKNDSLRRLAENPLLLTMLLVVKHGAGRLPPDRVTLYDRAVEVLLDTWNIKGHDPLNLKEAVPQLAYVAFQLMRQGRQTATEKELLALLEEARDNVLQIRRYAKDAPHEFLKRVELRSSLLVEAGHQLDGARAVPFYQFRHLTFQEYLAAVAAVEGHYMEYEKGQTVLAPLKPYLTAEEWKEVVPMAAVLARKQAEPLLAALVAEGNSLRTRMEKREGFPGEDEWEEDRKLPAPIARLAQCLAEEAEPSTETLTAALQLIAIFGKGCKVQGDWQPLGRGPYGEELLHQTWLLYRTMQWPEESWLRFTFAILLTFRETDAFWASDRGQAELAHPLRSQDAEVIVRGLLTFAGARLRKLDISAPFPWTEVERHFFHEDPAIWEAAVWAWALSRYHLPHCPIPSRSILDALLSLWLGPFEKRTITGFAITTLGRIPRYVWTPILTDEQRSSLRQALPAHRAHQGRDYLAGLIVAFHARDLIPEEDLAKQLAALGGDNATYLRDDEVNAMLQQMDEAGQKLLSSRASRRRKRN